MNYAFDFNFGSAKIQQKAYMKSYRLEIVHALGYMHIIKCFDGLQLNQYYFLNQ